MAYYLHERHGYGRWQAIVDDKELKIQEVICQELNLPFINLPVPGQAASQAQTGTNTANAEAPGTQLGENGSGNDIATDVTQGTTAAANQSPGESVQPFACPVAHELWSMVFVLFGVSWVMPSSVLELLACWQGRFGRHCSSEIWNAIPHCLMWCLWSERNARTFEGC
uniref:Uncharacterized protein n=1 Tax=Fagus sylvatica TaxID=28930 RepID=A0A2N9GHH3_FAGSY